MQDVTSQPWAPILEAAIKNAVEHNAKKMMLVFLLEDGADVAACYKSVEDLKKMAMGAIKCVVKHIEEGE